MAIVGSPPLFSKYKYVGKTSTGGLKYKMASHIWDVNKPQEGSVRGGVNAYQYARAHGADLRAALVFAGYYVETTRQAGGGFGLPGAHDLSISGIWTSGERGGRRYARGRNGTNYLRAGLKLVGITALIKGPVSGTTKQLLQAFISGQDVGFALHDSLLEDGQEESAKVFE
jgi:hypothetical protein